MSVFANKLNTGYMHKPGYSTTKRAHRREDTVRNTTWAGPTLTALHHYTGRPCTGNGLQATEEQRFHAEAAVRGC